MTEADTCRKYVVKNLYAAGWTDDHIREQKSITDGRILVAGNHIQRKKPKRVDYLLFYKPDFPIAVVEAKAEYKKAADGIQQAMEYAQMLDVKFAYATNGHEILEHDFLTGMETESTTFPGPEDLWKRIRQKQGIADDTVAERVLTPYQTLPGKTPRYYQTAAGLDALLPGVLDRAFRGEL